MNAYLLYPQREWENNKRYFDYQSITQDLGLKTLFSAASKKVIYEDGIVKKIADPDPFLFDTMKKVMMVPLETGEEIRYRQDILKDCINNEDFIEELYQSSANLLVAWSKLGRRANDKASKRNTVTGLVDDIHVLSLFVKGLCCIKDLCKQYEHNLDSKGFKAFIKRIKEDFSDKVEFNMKKILQDISFFMDDGEEGELKKINKPRIVFECGIEEGLKFDHFKLEEVTSKAVKYRGPKNPIMNVQKILNSLTPDSTAAQGSRAMEEQITGLEFAIVSYIVASCAPFISLFSGFFDQLHLESAFYRGAINIEHHMARFQVDSCFPEIGNQSELSFEDLKEIVMCMEQRVNAVGNTCNIKDKMLLIVTGANQGGKSTFLRSIGIAQIMFQCGLRVSAKYFCSGIFPSLFTHFTRREDSEMNSGRLDEELGRMNQIIEHLGKNSLILLNESFATTTEKEGSVIAYDIIKALMEAGVKILSVTHLLSFAQRIYNENMQNEVSKVTFLCAQRMEDGTRTYKMIQHAPELTSFGLDLYEDIIVKRKE